ncbi:MAG: hypothetical protein KJS97_16525 [Alphaproteobacteria bacterium]|nr:hypothetical protein [Alphaproteobacteria bacterium]
MTTDAAMQQAEANRAHVPVKADYWQARVAISAIIVLQLGLAAKVSAGFGLVTQWAAPVAELALLVTLTGYKWIEHFAARNHPSPAQRYLERHGGVRVVAVALIAAATCANFASLGRLLDSLLHAGRASGADLLDDAANLWTTNVICFALWYWEIDRGGPAVRGTVRERKPDFLFANMTAMEFCKASWRPGFIDFLFLSFTNATAFSPTDALPLTRRVKIMMMLQSAASLTTIALVAARAVNILA